MEEKTTYQPEHAAEVEQVTTQDAALLTDAALAVAGLQKITAFVRAEPSGNAKCKQRSREKSQQQGVKQLNLQLPVQAHQVFRDIAQELQRTDDVEGALQSVLDKLKPPAESLPEKGKLLQGWRRWLAVLLRLI